MWALICLRSSPTRVTSVKASSPLRDRKVEQVFDSNPLQERQNFSSRLMVASYSESTL